MASNHGECSPPTSFTLSWQKTKSAYLCGISRKTWYRNICPPANSKTLAEKKWQVMQMLQCGVWYAPKFSQVPHGSEPLHSSVKPISGLGATLAHLSLYRRKHKSVSRDYLRIEVEGMARMSDYAADEILDEIACGKGDLRTLGGYLFNRGDAQQQ